MEQKLKLSGKLTTLKVQKETPETNGPFCPIKPPQEGKGGVALKGGAVSSAFMSAFL